MTMGQRIRAARLEAGLSQRELAGEEMTRNMLSTLEHDGAKPSVGTLMYLSGKLCKPVGYFFGETEVNSGDVEKITGARAALMAGEYARCLELAADAGTVFQEEGVLLGLLAMLGSAERALEEGKVPYAKTLLEQCRDAGEKSMYFPLVERKWILLSAKTGNPAALAGLKGEEEALLLRAEAALEAGRAQRAAELLEAAEVREEEWNYLRGEAFFAREQYEKAAECYHKAEHRYPEKSERRLEICYREMGDFRKAYYYATKEKNGKSS